MYEINMLMMGFSNLIADPMILVLAVIGVALGIIIGVLPGLTATMGVAILLPFTFGMPPVLGILMLCGVFFGGIYAGSITAILLKIPGTPAAAATAMDGHALTEKGQAGLALGTATISSTIGGTISVLMLIFLAPTLARFALVFSASETFALAVFGLSIITSVSGDSLIKGLIAGFAGLLLSTVGLDPMGGFPRFTGGISDLYSVPFIPIMIGLFAASEAFKSLTQTAVQQQVKVVIGRIIPPWPVLRGLIVTILRSSGLGVIVGIMPGAGADVASFVAYNEAKRFSKNPENFGKGELSAVAACESGANSCTGGDLLPMMTLGIPGDAVTAVMLGALTMQGLQPGPLLFKDHADLVFTLFAGMLFCYATLLILGLSSLRLMGWVLQMPRAVLTPLILVLCVVGAYAINNSMFDIGLMLTVGVIGYIMQRLDFPLSPVVLALIMGPMAESNLRRALSLSNGSFDFLWTRPITMGLLAIALVTLLLPVWRMIAARRAPAASGAGA